MVVVETVAPNQTSQQVTEPNMCNSTPNTVVKSYTSTREIIHDITPIKGVITKVKLIVEYCCENNEIIQAIIDLPTSKFMDDDLRHKDNFNEVLTLYLKKSILFIKNTTPEERTNIHHAIDLKDYTITGVTYGPNGDTVHSYVDNDTNVDIQNYFYNTIHEEGGYEACEFVTFLINFPILAIGNECHVASPFRDDPPIQSQGHFSVSPSQDPTSNLHHDTSSEMLNHNRFAVLMDAHDDDDENPDASTQPVYHTSPQVLNPNWRNSPTPTGPWRHSNVRPQRDREGRNGDHISRAAPVQSNSSNTTNQQHQSQPTFTPFGPQPDSPQYGFVPLQTFDMTEFSITNANQYCATLNNTKTDLKFFSKKDQVPLQQGTSIINWYRRFTAHALRCGVFVPPFESLVPAEDLGAWFRGIDPVLAAQIPQMSSAIHAAVVNNQAIPPGPAYTDFLNDTCGYSALHDLIRDSHPRLAIHTVIYDRPVCKAQEQISDYVVRWREYLLIEHEYGRFWQRTDVARTIINNLPKEHRLWVLSQYDSLMLSKGPHVDLPPAFHMKKISKTISTLIKMNPHHSSSQNQYHNHHRSSHTLSASPLIVDDHACVTCSQSNALQSTEKHCALCDTTSHALIDCHKYINYCLCQRYAASHPSTVSDILRTHKHPPITSRTSAKPRYSHAIASDQASPLISTNHDDSDSDDDPNTTTPTTAVAHSLSTSRMSNYNEDDDTDDESPDEDNIDRHCISSIGFDFDTTFSSQPTSIVATAEVVDTPLATIVHSVENDTQEITQAIGGQFDSGANMNTTNHLGLLWNIHKLKSPRYTVDAGQTRHAARYRGYLILPCTRQGHAGYIAIATYYTPTIGVTLIAPSAIRDQYGTIVSWTITDSNNIASATFFDSDELPVFAMPLYADNNLHWTAPFIRPSIHQRRSTLPSNLSMSVCSSGFIDIVDTASDDMLVDDWSEFASDDAVASPYADENVCHAHPLQSRTKYQLWHQRLGHLQPRTITELHKHVDGIPTLPTPTILDNCPVCITSKMRRAASSPSESRDATQCHQSLSIDMAFIVQKSSNSDRFVTNVGLKGETCYVLITDYYSGMVHGKALVNKGPPIEYFNQWLARFNPDITNKTVRFDQGGELGRCRQVLKLFQDFGFTIQLTGADSSHQNGSVERSHQTIGNMIRSLLHGASLERKFWPFAFYHSLFILNRIPHHNKPSPPITICSGRRLSLEALRVFGCRIYVRLPGERRAKLDTHTSSGIFLGYNETMKNIFWYDTVTAQIKTASHVRFNEGMADVTDPPPNVQLLQRIEHNTILPDVQEVTINPIDFQLDPSPFRTLDTVQLTIVCDSPSFGFVFAECHIRHRAYVSDILPNTSASRIRNARRKYIGAFVVQLHTSPIYALEDAATALASIKRDPSITSFDIILAPDKYIPVRDRREPLRINAAQLHSITTLCLASPSMISHSIAADHDPSVTPITPDEHRIQSHITRSKLRKLTTWPLWQLAEYKQLDAHHLQDMFGDPMMPPDDAIVLHPHWTYKIKLDGTRSARECCDGSPRAAPALHQDAITYASCIELPCMRLFFSIASIRNHIVLLTDAVNAYANARGPTIPTYIRVDDAFIDWYLTRFNVTLHRGMVVRANHALQGHPEAGKLFEELANDILLNRLGLTTTTHERNLYRGSFDGHIIYVCRQVDDLAISAPTIEIGQKFIAAIGSHVNIAGNSILVKFNGAQVEQSREYIRIHSEDYIDRLLSRHGWATPSSTDSATTYTKEPMTASVYKQLDTEVGPPEHSAESIALAQSSGFSFRQLLGELIYCYVSSRLDIGYSLTKLAQYSQHPAPIHFAALKHVALYLRSTKSWGIMYWRPHPLLSLPPGTIAALPVSTDPSLPPFPVQHPPDRLLAFVDASHGTDQSRRSVTGYVLTFCAGAVCYRSKVQVATAISSTEAELVASVMSAKAVKYIRTVLTELDYTQHDPTPIYEDNAASILIVNASKPTPRTRHIDIQFFAIQQWKALGLIVLLAIAGTINIADGLTKALGWVLQHRHARRAMGHHACQFTSSAPAL